MADARRYPYFAHLSIHSSSGLYECGGILITNDLIVSAAHCVHGLDQIHGIRVVVNMTTYFDAYSFDMEGPSGYEQIRDVEDFRPHPQYNSVTQQNDVMLLVLEHPVMSIPFPDIPVPTFEAEERSPVTVIGFGVTEARSTLATQLMEVEVEMISTDDCNARNSYDGVVDEETMICAGFDHGGKVRTVALFQDW